MKPNQTNERKKFALRTPAGEDPELPNIPPERVYAADAAVREADIV